MKKYTYKYYDTSHVEMYKFTVYAKHAYDARNKVYKMIEDDTLNPFETEIELELISVEEIP